MLKSAKIIPFLAGVKKTLKENVELMSMCNGLYDWVPEETDMPFITFGRISVFDDDTKCIPGSKIELDIVVWDTGKGRLRSLKMIEQIELSLTRDDLEVNFPDTIDLVEWDVEIIENEEQQYGLYCSVVKFVGRVE